MNKKGLTIINIICILVGSQIPMKTPYKLISLIVLLALYILIFSKMDKEEKKKIEIVKRRNQSLEKAREAKKQKRKQRNKNKEKNYYFHRFLLSQIINADIDIEYTQGKWFMASDTSQRLVIDNKFYEYSDILSFQKDPTDPSAKEEQNQDTTLLPIETEENIPLDSYSDDNYFDDDQAFDIGFSEDVGYDYDYPIAPEPKKVTIIINNEQPLTIAIEFKNSKQYYRATTILSSIIAFNEGKSRGAL